MSAPRSSLVVGAAYLRYFPRDGAVVRRLLSTGEHCAYERFVNGKNTTPCHGLTTSRKEWRRWCNMARPITTEALQEWIAAHQQVALDEANA